MKQTIRIETFETNSSSYHTLSIYHASTKPKPKEIIKGQDIEINNQIAFKCIGCTDSYQIIGNNNYTKAQMVLRFIAPVIDDQICDIISKEQKQFETYEDRVEYAKGMFYITPIVIAFIDAIRRYIGDDQNVIITFNRSACPFILEVRDSNEYVNDVFGVNKEDFKNIKLMTDKFYDIIFNDSIEMSEECDSNE